MCKSCFKQDIYFMNLKTQQQLIVIHSVSFKAQTKSYDYQECFGVFV